MFIFMPLVSSFAVSAQE